MFLSDPRTPVVALASALLAVAVAGPVARRLGWARWPTLGALLGLAAVLTLTLSPAPGAPIAGPSLAGLGRCARSLADPTSLTWAFSFASGRGERVGNIAMFVPLAFFAALASRRPLAAGAACALAPAAIELAQALSGAGRTCYGYDWVDNATGALLGAAAAGLWLAAARRRRAAPRGTPAGRLSGDC